MKGNFYTLKYAGILGCLCALLLTFAANFTEPYRNANADAERKRNILKVLDVPFDEKISSLELVEIFESNVKAEKIGELEIYRYIPPKDSNGTEIAALAFEGPGLWGPIKGFLALKPDMRTIQGVTFYQQEETPGLGGEIASSGFTSRFKGKLIVDGDGNPGIIISSGKDTVNHIDAITGATMTCDKVEEMINNVVKTIVSEN
ncbi:MAG: FMN-binding protein [Phycisphaerae bacterium]|nr:FMN-binding protein [Phycisphaerae bacterium]